MGEAESENANRRSRMLKRAVVFVPKRSRARCSADCYKAGFKAFCGSHPPLPHPRPAQGFHRVRHYGLFAGSNRAETIEHVRKLLNCAPPAADASPKGQQASQTDEPQPLAQPCPCCGGRMFVIETFEAGFRPCHQPTAPLVVIRIDTS